MSDNPGTFIFSEEDGDGFGVSTIEDLENDELDLDELDEQDLGVRGKKLWKVTPKVSSKLELSDELDKINEWYGAIEGTEYEELAFAALEVFQKLLEHEADSEYLLSDSKYDELRPLWDELKEAVGKEEDGNPDLSEAIHSLIEEMEIVIQKKIGLDPLINE